MSLNSVTVSGHLAADPELRQTQSGMTVMSLRLAVNDRRKNQQTQQWEDYTNWVPCTMFGDRASKVAQYLSKGSKVAVLGKLRYSEWEKDGQKRSKLEVIVDDIDFMSQRQGGSQPSYGQQAQQYAPQQAPQVPQQQMPPQMPQQYAPQIPQQPLVQQQVMDVYSDDIPF